MKTTIEIQEEVGKKLRELAGQRGETEISGLVAEALDRYLADQSLKRGDVEEVLKLGGTLSDQDADHFREVLRDLRSA